MSIWSLITEALQKSHDANPREVGRILARRMSDQDKLQHFEGLLIDACVVQNSRVRRSTYQPLPDPQPERQPVGTARRQPPSSKVAAIRGFDWNKELNQRLKMGDEWVFLRDATLEHLLAAAKQRRRDASGQLAVASRYERLARVLTATGATAVGQIPEAEAVAAWNLGDAA